MTKERKYTPMIRYWLPQACVNLEDIKNDIKDLYERGFSGIEVVAFQTAFEIEKKYLWGSTYWNQVINTILKEAKKYSMRVDITNGPQWPIAMPSIDSPTHKASLYELTYGTLQLSKGESFQGNIPTPRVIHPDIKSSLIALFVYDSIHSNILDRHSYQNLFSDSDQTTVSFKANNDCIMFAFYEQPACQKVLNKYFVIDHLSKEGSNACIHYFENNLFPSIHRNLDSLTSIFCDSLEYKVSMEWTRNFDSQFIERKGYSLLPYLPIIGLEKTYPNNDIPNYVFNHVEITKQIQYDYLEMITYLYTEYHLKYLQEYFSAHNLSLRYQVAYNKPFQVELSALTVTVPETEALNRPTIDNLRMMSGAVHIDHKSTYSYECSAEFLNGYGQSYEDLLWWIKRGYLGGINHQVLHGATYSGKLSRKEIKWPGYEPFGQMVSNYWNRTLSKEQAKSFIDRIGYYNQILSYRHKVDIAIYRHEYLNPGKGSDGNHLFKDDSLFIQHGYSYDFLSPELLQHKNSIVKDYRLDVDGPSYKALLIVNQEQMTLATINKLNEFIYQDFPIIFIGQLPYYSSYYSLQEENISIEKAISAMLKQKSVYYFTTIKEAFNHIRQILPSDATYDHQAPIATIHTEHQIDNYYYLYHYQPITYGLYPTHNKDKEIFNPEAIYPTINKDKYFHNCIVTLSLVGQGIPYVYDPLTKQYQEIEYTRINDRKIKCKLSFKADEAKVILISSNVKSKVKEVLINDSYKTLPLTNWNLLAYSLVPNSSTSIFSDFNYQLVNSYSLHQLLPLHQINDELEFFAGKIIYRTTFELDDSKEVFLYIENVCDTFQICINEKTIYPTDTYHTTIRMTDYITCNNTLTIIVYTNLYSYLQKQKRDYGMYGNVTLLYL